LGETVENFDLISEFGTSRVYASWFTGEIRSQLGSMLSYMHDGYGSVFERERCFDIIGGLLSSIKDSNYVEYEIGRLHPSIDYLTDTIERIIYNHVDTARFRNIKEDENFELIVVFDRDGRIDRISENYGDDSPVLSTLIMNAANLSLEKFPRIMKVNHERYSPPIIRIWFNGHCLKYPDDAEYGCKDYRKLIDVEPVKLKGNDVNPILGNKWILILSSIVILTIGFVLFIIKRRK
jgi:hypothetical protein